MKDKNPQRLSSHHKRAHNDIDGDSDKVSKPDFSVLTTFPAENL